MNANCASNSGSPQRGSPRGTRLPRTVASLALTFASVGALMECENVSSPWALAAKREGQHPRVKAPGVRVVGRYNAYWRGQNLVHPGWLADWGCQHSGLRRLAGSPLFGTFQGGEPLEQLLRDRDAIEDDALYLALHPELFSARRSSWSAVLPRVAATGVWEAVEYLWNAAALLAIESPEEVELRCASYLPGAIALWACTPSGSKAGPLLWALMRKHLLDGQREGGRRLRWERVDLKALITVAQGLRPAQVSQERFDEIVVPRFQVPAATLRWIEQSRPEWGRGSVPKAGRVGIVQLRSMLSGLHENAWTLIRREFDKGEPPDRTSTHRGARFRPADSPLRSQL